MSGKNREKSGSFGVEDKWQPCDDSSETPGPSCSKLTTSLVNLSLKFQR